MYQGKNRTVVSIRLVCFSLWFCQLLSTFHYELFSEFGIFVILFTLKLLKFSILHGFYKKKQGSAIHPSMTTMNNYCSHKNFEHDYCIQTQKTANQNTRFCVSSINVVLRVLSKLLCPRSQMMIPHYLYQVACHNNNKMSGN